MFLDSYSILIYLFSNNIVDQCTSAMIDPLIECRSLWGGPFNPKFDVCKKLEDTLTKVLLHFFIFFQTKIRNIVFITLNVYFQCFCLVLFLWEIKNCNLSSSKHYPD